MAERRLAPLALALVAAVGCTRNETAPGRAASGPEAEKLAGHWCRLDDPGPVEVARASRELEASQVWKIACSTTKDAAGFPAEIALPMPCGRYMVFRRVETSTSHLLDQQEVFLGQPAAATGRDAADARDAFTSGPWSTTLAGPLRSQDGTQGFYYIGKYEVSAPQFALWKEGLFLKGKEVLRPAARECEGAMKRAAAIAGAQVLPAVSMSVFDAEAFAAGYTAWLLSLDSGSGKVLPLQDSAPAYLRLPTEVEWEYAARGGQSGRADQASRTYKVRAGAVLRDAELSEIAFVRGLAAEGAPGSRVFFEGRRLPNVLGLYDMVGNVDEWTADLFRPTRPDGLGGRTGGRVTRGGSALDDESRIGVGYRAEAPPFSSSGPYSGEATGFRLVMAAPFFANARSDNADLVGNPGLEKALVQARQQLSAGGDSAASQSQAAALAQVRRLESSAAGQQGPIAGELTRVRQSLETAQAQLNDRDRQLRREAFLSAVMIARSVTMYEAFASTSLREVDDVVKRSDEATRRDPEFQRAVAASRARAANIRAFSEGGARQYASLVLRLSRAGPAERRLAASDAAQVLVQNPQYARMPGLVTRHIEQAAVRPGEVPAATIQTWRRDLLSAQ